jgi:predicted DCC family thiol-disulfide oxidoreductase YuxK
MKNAWTGGQYSLFRIVLGAYLLVHFLQLAPWGAEVFSSAGVLPEASLSPLARLFPNIFTVWDAPVFVTCCLFAGAALAVLFAIGYADRFAAVALWYLWACLFGRNPLIANPALPYIGWILLAHALLPAAPYGSLAARGRVDPRGSWRMPPPIFAVAWILMALGYTYSGWTKLVSPSWIDGSAIARILQNPLARPGLFRNLLMSLPLPMLRAATWSALGLELSFGPLALWRRARPWIWLAMVVLHLKLLVLLDFTDLSLGMIMLHLFTFDPGWIRPEGPGAPETIFYDGGCGLCHRAVRFILAEDFAGDRFRFSPLGGETFAAAVPGPARRALPDSLVVHTTDGRLLTRSAGVRHIMRGLGGVWRVAAIVSGIVPRAVLDGLYDLIARIRSRLFTAPKEACPILPSDLRRRFLP